jgi:hypothetical protein
MVKVLEKERDIRTARSFLTFTSLAGLVPDPDLDLGRWYAAWNCSSFTNDFRTFIFNTRNNFLPLNNRLNAYIEDVDPSCTYCRVSVNRPAPRDSMAHCFINCPEVREILIVFNSLIGIEDDIDSANFQSLYWYGTKDTNICKKIAHIFVYDSFRYIFFKKRLRRIRIEVDPFLMDLMHHIRWTSKFNTIINLSIRRTFANTRFLQALG